MPQARNPREEIEFLENFKEFIDASQHIASIRIRNAKASVVAKRDFAHEMAVLFQKVKEAYRQELEKAAKKKGADPQAFSFLERNRKTAYVLLSANAGLYGDIIKKTFNLFAENFDSMQGDAIIIGRFGKNLFEAKFPGVEYTFFEFSEKRVEPENFRWVIENLARYQKVLCFYGQFKSLISQEAQTISISGDQPQTAVEQPEEKTGYLLEPTPENVMIFFETQIIASIFEQTVFESQLAKFASRMLTMHYAHENINERLEKETYNAMRLDHQIENKKQTDRLAGRTLWKT